MLPFELEFRLTLPIQNVIPTCTIIIERVRMFSCKCRASGENHPHIKRLETFACCCLQIAS